MVYSAIHYSHEQRMEYSAIHYSHEQRMVYSAIHYSHEQGMVYSAIHYSYEQRNLASFGNVSNFQLSKLVSFQDRHQDRGHVCAKVGMVTCVCKSRYGNMCVQR